MAFKLKGFPMHNTSALKQKSAFKQGDPAAMEAMMGMMGGGAPGGDPAMGGGPEAPPPPTEPTVDAASGATEKPKDDGTVTMDEFQAWIMETEPEGWEGSDGVPETEEQEAAMKKAIAKINKEKSDLAEAERMPLILAELEK